MKASLYRNIDLVQIRINAGTDEYVFPRNVDWVGKKIDRLVIVAPQNACVSPIDGQTPVLTASQLNNLYLDLYNDKDDLLQYEAHYSNFMYTNNNPIPVDAILNLQLSRIRFSKAPESSGVLLMYVFWNTDYNDAIEEPRRSKTIKLQLQPGEYKTFAEISNVFIYVDGQKVRGLQFWTAESDPCYITLRDEQLKHVINNVHSVLARPQMTGAVAEDIQCVPMRFDSLDIDFDYSFIRNASDVNVANLTITFEY